MTVAPEREALLALADEIDVNFRIGADHRFSDEEARTIQAALRLAAKPSSDPVAMNERRVEEDEVKSTIKTCLDYTGLKITNELYKAVSGHTGDACLLAMIGSWGDTLDDPDILAGLHRYNEMGECFIPDRLSTAGEPKR